MAVNVTHAGNRSMELCRRLEARDQVSVRFVVRDSGIGNSSRWRSRPFLNPSCMRDSSTTRSYGGTGLAFRSVAS